MLWRQWVTERRLARRGVYFRSTEPGAVARAYAGMGEGEFDRLNGRQAWANWRTIPRSLSGRVPDRALRVLDLDCGTGSSTRVLAHYCPRGSDFTGYDQSPQLVAVARARDYRHQSGSAAAVRFLSQGLAESLRDATGAAVGAATVDVVNASGVVGHHFDDMTVRPLVAELGRVMRPGGVAMLDVGPSLGDRSLTRVMAGAGFRRLARTRSCFLDVGGQVTYQKQ